MFTRKAAAVLKHFMITFQWAGPPGFRFCGIPSDKQHIIERKILCKIFIYFRLRSIDFLTDLSTENGTKIGTSQGWQFTEDYNIWTFY